MTPVVPQKAAALEDIQGPPFIDLATPATVTPIHNGLPLATPVAVHNTQEALNIALRVIAEQQRRISELEGEATTDLLTGLLNKRGFARAFERECERAQRSGEATALLVMFDLDGLKQINDTYGHPAGDAYIRGFAASLKHAVRTTDYIGRIGGDEFALILTDTSVQRAWERIAIIAEVLNQHYIKHDGKRFKLCASHGCSAIKAGEHVEQLIADADARLYENKRQRKRAQLH
ncbi:MAG: GGDEF domain-containing protein [Bdellovibrionales bacterium]